MIMIKNIYCALVALFLIGIQANAQLNVSSAASSGNWAEYYVEDVLLGTGVEAFNITFTGADTTGFNPVGIDSAQLAEFTSNNTVVEIPYGLLLSTGSAEAHSGSAVNPSPGPFSSDGAGDVDLQQIIGPSFSLHNRAILEFDFVPQGDTIRFKYTFASLEYPGFVCSSFNDVFGFFLSGPGINGPYSNNAENLAILPGTNTEVSINSVNDIPGGGNCNPACPCNSQYFVNNYTAPVDTNVLFGGLTVTLEAVSPVVCGDTYHIKMAIADAGDGALDSGVFLEGGSFTSNLIEVDISTVNGDSTINEGCGEADILFTRGDTTDTSITYLNFSGTATNGVDFALLPDSIVLLPGVFDTTITISPFADAIPEGMETFTIEAISVTLCNDTFISTGTLYIYDVPYLTLNITPDTTFTCPPQSLDLWVDVLSGGPPPFTYLWNTGQTADSIQVTLSPNGGVDTFYVAIQDSCALATAYDTIFVTKDYEDDPVPQIMNDSLVNCAGESITLECVVDFGTQPFTYLWPGGDTTSTYEVTVNGNMQLVVTVTDNCGRQATDTAFLGVKVPENFSVEFPDSTIFCVGSELFVNPEYQGGVMPYIYSWDQTAPVFDDDSTITVTINGDTTLYFWVKDACGSEFNTTFFVDAIEVDTLEAFLSNQGARCSGTEFVLNPDISGGLAPLHFDWSTGDTDTVITFVGSVTQNVGLTVTDFCGNEANAQALIEIPEYAPIEMFLSGSTTLCYGDEYLIEARAVGGAGEYEFEWIPVNPPVLGETFEKIDVNKFRVISRQNNVHFVRVNDFCGNSDGDSLSITIEPCLHIPNVITPNGDNVNDAFYIQNITSFDDAHLVIYNRWGQKVFDSLPYRNEWIPFDEPEGTYFYVLRSSHFNELRGDLTVIKDED